MPDFARGLEFLMTSGPSYTSSSVGGNTRKYHGLLVRNGRLLLAGLDEMVNGVRISAQQYENAPNDEGLQYLFAFSAYPPVWVYLLDDIIVKKTVSFERNLTIVYDICGDADLWVRPLITNRSVHEVLRDPHPEYTDERNGFRWADLLFCGNLSYKPDLAAYWNVWYQQEYERGYDPVEDLISPGVFSGRVRDATIAIQCTGSSQFHESRVHAPSQKTLLDWLDRASDTFCHGNEIIAGYHWFCESWGRDSAISVPGLLIGRGKKEEARLVLTRLSAMARGGLLPNRFPDNYHSSDASMWFILALSRYRRCWGDDPFMGSMKSVISTILEEYPCSSVASLDNNLIAVEPKSTWMDTGFTPRTGKPVEINALWIHALEEADAMGIRTIVHPELAREEFQRFWNENTGCLYDCLDPVDTSIRPNQVIAVALGLIDQKKAASTLDIVNAQLLTPYGLRSLSPGDPAYEGRYRGDSSYHNGCVWPWLTGFYAEACLRNGMPRDRIARILDPLLFHIREAGIGYLSEIFDGDYPYLPRGCIAQAWSVAEIARAYRLLFEQS